MIGKVVPKQRPDNPLHYPPSKAAVTRRGLESARTKEGVGLADLRDADKAKVARLINHVMIALREIQCLKNQLELERSNQEAQGTKLQQSKHNVAAEVSQLRLKLASLQLLSPIPCQKVYIHTKMRSSLLPIREAEVLGAESKATGRLASKSNAEMKSITTELENQSRDLMRRAGQADKYLYNKSLGTEQRNEHARMVKCEAFCLQPSVLEVCGKENKDPEFLPQLTGDVHMADKADSVVLCRRPPPRPLPNLLNNILLHSKFAGSGPSIDHSGHLVKCVSNGDASNASVHSMGGNFALKPLTPQSPSLMAQASWSSLSLDQDYFKLSVTEGREAGDKDELGSQCPKGGWQHKALPCIERANCPCPAVDEGLRNCQTLQFSNLMENPSLDQLGRSEKVSNKICENEDLRVAETSVSQKKIQCDPTAAKDGIFYHVSDVEINTKDNLEEREGVQLGAKTQEVSSSMSMEGQRLDQNKVESHWTPEVIEKRNSFHRIPVISLTSVTDNERHADEVFPNNFRTKIMENIAGMLISSTEEQEKLPNSESEGLPFKKDKSLSPKSRQSLQLMSKCIYCSSIACCRFKRASLPWKAFVNYTRRCLKCSSIVEPKSSTHRLQDKVICRSRGDKSSFNCPKGRQCLNEEHGRESKEGFNRADPSTPTTTENVSRCGEHAPRLRPNLFRPLPSKPRRGKVRRRKCVPREEEVSDLDSGVLCDVSEDMYTSTHCRYHSTKVRKCVNWKCRIHTRKKQGSQREMLSVKSLSDQIQTCACGRSHKNSCKESTKEVLEKRSTTSSRSFPLHGRLDVNVDKKRGLSLTCECCQRGRRSASFESTLLRPSPWITNKSGKESTDSTASKLLLQSCTVAGKGTKTFTVSTGRVQPRTELSCGHHNYYAFRKRGLEQCEQCSKRSICLNSGIATPSVVVNLAETKELPHLCEVCSTSGTSEKRILLRRSADLGPDEPRHTAADTPIFLPYSNLDETSKSHEVGTARKMGSFPCSSAILICNAKKPGKSIVETIHNPADLSGVDHRMPIITGHSVSSRQSTPAREMEEGGTAKVLTEMFDISLFDLVKDVEGQRRDYWERVNSHSKEDKIKGVKKLLVAYR